MKKQINIFTQLAKRYDLSDFYSINLNCTGIALQGFCTNKNLKLLSDNMTTMTFGANNFLRGSVKFASIQVEITLTPNN